ncbi:MAG: 6-phosphofructokinase [Phycisphaerae bacterium]|nr:6-phosphofructokinase [Phycisphaerae bacterium]
MSDAGKGNVVIGQSGGPTAVINQSLVGAVEVLKDSDDVGRIMGARHGVAGIVAENFVDLNDVDAAVLEAVANTPAAALGSSRDKPDEAYCRKIFEVFKKNDVKYFFYIGGNDSADAARIVNEMASASDYELRTFHIPKTIDNDLRVTDHCPGYGSAAKFVASAFMGDDRDSAALPGIKINVVMGRDAGWLTAASVLGNTDPVDGPHLVYVPEVEFSTEQFLADVREIYGRLGRCQIAVSEGIKDKTGTSVTVALAETLGHRVERDSHGNPQLSGTGALGDFLSDYLKANMKVPHESLRVRADTFGYLQRSFAGYASQIDRIEARQCGRKAAEYAMSGDLDGSVAMKRVESADYQIEYVRAELSDVARVTKPLPRDFINESGNGITEGFISYAAPLVGELPVLGKL